MEWESTLRHARVSARKARLVADTVRGLPVGVAMGKLQFRPQKAAGLIRKVLHAAISSASQSSGVDEDKLIVKTITVDEGRTSKRWVPRAMGRATRIRKRTSHIRVALAER
jgi:large subunit ribosomal protein L22